MDDALHRARIDPRTRLKATAKARLEGLPDGAFIGLPDGVPRLLWRGALHPYLGAGYGPPEPAQLPTEVEVLTPAPTVAALRAGYRPSVGIEERS